MKQKIRKITFFRYFLIATLSGIILIAFTFIFNFSYAARNTKNVKTNLEKVEMLLDNLKPDEEKKAIIETRKAISEAHKDFMYSYYTIQADWLNKWLAFLAVVLAFFGILIPICFVKFLENKEKEMDRIIEDTIKQKEKTKLNVEEMTKQLDEVREKSKQMSKELEEVKGYVNRTEAASKYMEAVSKFQNKEYEKAKNLFIEALKIYPNKNEALANLGITYFHLGEYSQAKECLNRAISINPKSQYYINLSSVAEKEKDYKNAVEYAKKAFNLEEDNTGKAIYAAYIATYYSFGKDFINTDKYIAKALEIDGNNLSVKSVCAAALINKKEYKKAIIFLSEVIRKTGGSAVDFYNLAEAYIMEEQFEKAIAALSRYKAIQNKEAWEKIEEDNYNTWINKVKESKILQHKEKLLTLIESLEVIERN